MIDSSMIRRGMVAALGSAALAGCQVIPKAPPTTPTPAPTPTDALPADQQRHRIALLVPLAGPNAAVGQALANAATMALLDTNATSLRITTYDISTGPAAAAKKAVAEGARLILGPMQAEEVAAVAAIAGPAKVPVIAYSSDSRLAGRDVFVMGLDPANAMRRTIAYARGKGLRKFALLSPAGDYGERARAAFGPTITASGGSVIAGESYDRTNTSVVSAARRLKARGGFDAVMLADGARYAVLAAPQLKTASSSTPRLLGSELWSGDGQVAKAATLTGSWYAALSDTRFRQFSESYKARFGTAPYRVATLGYDSVLLAVRVARDWRAGTTFPLSRLTDRGGFLGLDGPFRFTANGTVERSLEVREVRAGAVSVVSPAPNGFTD